MTYFCVTRTMSKEQKYAGTMFLCLFYKDEGVIFLFSPATCLPDRDITLPVWGSERPINIQCKYYYLVS